MPFKKLIVELGGLCMLVIRKTGAPEKRGLYVLMPQNHHFGEVHCPLFVAEAQHSVTNRPAKADLRLRAMSDEVDLRNLAAHSEDPAPLPQFVANLSKFYGRNARPVKDDCFDKAPMDGLAARIVLPLPTKIKPVGFDADLYVPGEDTGVFKRLFFKGRCEIEYDFVSNIEDPLVWNKRIKGEELRPDANNTVRMYFVNARPKDFLGKTYKHGEGELWTHQQVYHSLIKDGSSNTGARAIFATGTTDGEDDIPVGEDCRDIRINAWPPTRMINNEVHIMYIDPYTCTLGGGCPQGEC